MRVRLINGDFSKCEVIQRLCIEDICPKQGEVYEVAVWHKHKDMGCESAYELVGFDFTEYGTAIAFNAERFEIIEKFHPNAWSPEMERVFGNGYVEQVRICTSFEIELPDGRGEDSIGEWIFEGKNMSNLNQQQQM